MKNIIQKLFCLHKWYSHAKEVYNWEESEVIKVLGYEPLLEKQQIQKTREILICEKCGKIRKIEY